MILLAVHAIFKAYDICIKNVIRIFINYNAGRGPICVSDISNLAVGSLGTRPQKLIQIFGEKKI